MSKNASNFPWGTDDSQTPILHIDMDSFFAAVEVREDSSLRNKPVVVGGASARGVVTSATYEARAFGIRAGMPSARARSLCPNCVFLPGRLWLYREVSKEVMALLGEITPHVEQISIDEAFLDVLGARRRLGTPLQVAAHLREQIRSRLGLPASVGIAKNKSVAKIASTLAKPDGVFLVPSPRTVEFLHSLPIGALWGVGTVTEKNLKTRGIDTVKQLSEVPPGELEQWVGAASAHSLHRASWGQDDRAVGGKALEKSISAEQTFSTNVTQRGELEKVLVAQAHKCASRARKANLLASTVSIKVRNANFKTITRSKTLPSPTSVGRAIASTGVELLSNLSLPRGGVRLIGLGISGLVSQDDAAPTLFDEDTRQRDSETVMDLAEERFGVGALRPASLVSRQPRDESSGKLH